jgi:hypothetical protein
MATKFAMPVAHQATTSVTRGDREFCQPISGAPAGSVPGIEIFLPDSDPGFRVFACFDGALRWVQGGGSVPNRLELLVDPVAAVKALVQVGKTVEGRPYRLVYTHVERDGARAALTSLVRQAFQNSGSNPKTWHPVLRLVRKEEGSPPMNIKKTLDQKGIDFALTIVDEFLNGQGDMQVLSGDHIGNADKRAPTPPDPNVQRHVVLSMIDVGGQSINPLYYIYLYFVTRTSQVTVTDNLAHPLFSAFPELQGISSPPARKALPAPSGTGSEDRVALGDLKFTHRTPRGRVTWFYNADGKIEIEGEGELLPTANDKSLVTGIWNQSGSDIALMCSKFQVPCELVLAVVSGESVGDRKAYRFEPMDRTALPKAASRADLLVKYDKMLGARITSYEPTRLPAVTNFNAPVITQLACHLNEAVQVTANGKIKNSISRSVFLVDDVWRPVLQRFSTTPAATTNHSVDVREERFVQDFTQEGTVQIRANRAGRIRVARAKLASGINSETTIQLSGSVGAFTLKVDRQKTTGFSLDGIVDVAADDDVTITVTAGGQPLKLTLEWFLGVEGEEGETTAANMWLIPDGNGSASPLFSPYPDPFDGAQALRNDRTNPDGSPTDENMSWDDVLTLVGLTGGQFLSPGLTQTLVSTAFAILNQVERQLAPGLRAELGIPAVANAGALLSTGWLTNARNSLFVGIATMRVHYAERHTRFDLPIVHGWFFGGGPLTLDKDVTRWGISTPTATFIDLLGRRYNAAVEMFKGPVFPTPGPTVRFSP